MIVVLMGVSGSGKTTIGTLLAQRAGVVFADADDYHPQANKVKMASGQPLTDIDRAPWLDRLNVLLREWYDAGLGGVLACSALKETYRETLGREMPAGAVQFVLLDGSPELIGMRLAMRQHEFMNPHLLASQFKTLEKPEDGYEVVNDRAPLVVVEEILGHLGAASLEAEVKAAASATATATTTTTTEILASPECRQQQEQRQGQQQIPSE